jgi:hypothetical protein
MDLGVRTWGNGPNSSTIMLTGISSRRKSASDSSAPAAAGLAADTWNCPVLPLLTDEIVKDEPGQQVVLDRLSISC